MIMFCIVLLLGGARICIDGVYDIHLVFQPKCIEQIVRRLKLMSNIQCTMLEE